MNQNHPEGLLNSPGNTDAAGVETTLGNHCSGLDYVWAPVKWFHRTCASLSTHFIITFKTLSFLLERKDKLCEIRHPGFLVYLCIPRVGLALCQAHNECLFNMC